MISDISDLSTSERYFYLAAIDCCKNSTLQLLRHLGS